MLSDLHKPPPNPSPRPTHQAFPAPRARSPPPPAARGDTEWRSTPLDALMLFSARPPHTSSPAAEAEQQHRSRIAQLAEQPAVNRQVIGSSPIAGAYDNVSEALAPETFRICRGNG